MWQSLTVRFIRGICSHAMSCKLKLFWLLFPNCLLIQGCRQYRQSEEKSNDYYHQQVYAFMLWNFKWRLFYIEQQRNYHACCQITFVLGPLWPTLLQTCRNHRGHTILLSRERVNKGTKRINSLPSSPIVTSYATLQRKTLLTSPA